MSQSLTVGSTTVQATYEPWPNYWPNYNPTYVWPTWTVPTVARSDEYANEVEVEQSEHDATLRFYRKQGTSRTLVKVLTVPLGVLEWMQAKH